MAPYTVPETAAWRLRYLIEYLLFWHNGNDGHFLKHVFVCQIIPNTAYPDRILEFNNGVAQLVQDANDGLIPQIAPGVVRLVDQYSTFNVGTMLGPDGVHPTDPGYQHMADVFLNAFGYLPMHMVRVTEESVSGAKDQELAPPLQVRINDRYGSGVPGVDVYYDVIDGNAILLDFQPVQTDESGIAEGRLMLGSIGVSTVMVYSPGLIDSTTTFTRAPSGLAR